MTTNMLNSSNTETDSAILEAIAYIASNDAEAVRIWDAPTEAELLAVWERATNNGLIDARTLCWGAAGSTWADSIIKPPLSERLNMSTTYHANAIKCDTQTDYAAALAEYCGQHNIDCACRDFSSACMIIADYASDCAHDNHDAFYVWVD